MEQQKAHTQKIGQKSPRRCAWGNDVQSLPVHSPLLDDGLPPRPAIPHTLLPPAPGQGHGPSLFSPPAMGIGLLDLAGQRVMVILRKLFVDEKKISIGLRVYPKRWIIWIIYHVLHFEYLINGEHPSGGRKDEGGVGRSPSPTTTMTTSTNSVFGGKHQSHQRQRQLSHQCQRRSQYT